MKIIFKILLILFVIPCCGQEIIEVQSVSSKSIVVVLETDWININVYNRQTTYEDFKPNLSNWSINGNNIIEVGLQTKVIDERKGITIENEIHFPIKMQHSVYLNLTDPLLEDDSYIINSDYGDYQFTFEQNQI